MRGGIRSLIKGLAGAAAALAVLVGVFLAGYALKAPAGAPVDEGGVAVTLEREKDAEVWTCAMHPQVRLSKPGQCPICGMELIPVAGGGGDVGERVFATTPEAVALMEVEVAPVARKSVSVRVRMVGKVEYDETRLKYITAWVGGRIDRLYVDFTGVVVEEGAPMVYLYSPKTFAAEEELLQAVRAVSELSRSTSAYMRQAAQRTLESTRKKLRLLGLEDAQIGQIEDRGTAADHITINAPIGGTVVEKHAQEGMYVDTGMRIYTIADLSHVWVRMDAYESDLEWVREGARVTFTAEAFPGEQFTGTVAFVDPFLQPRTRSVKVRVDVPNPEGRLKPGMFVRAVLEARLGGDGAGEPLVIPASAALVTGKRALVYVQIPGAAEPTFQGREVVLGERAGDYYVVREGLEEGELVVTKGNFKIDSALQIQARPSMMSPEGGAPPPGHAHGGMEMPGVVPQPQEAPVPTPQRFQGGLGALWHAYAQLVAALADDDLDAARVATAKALSANSDVPADALSEEAVDGWRTRSATIAGSLEAMSEAEDLAGMRARLDELSQALASAIGRFGIGADGPVYELKCPMAGGGAGAVWLQGDMDVRNPYFGPAMLDCGSVVETVVPPTPAGERLHE